MDNRLTTLNSKITDIRANIKLHLVIMDKWGKESPNSAFSRNASRIYGIHNPGQIFKTAQNELLAIIKEVKEQLILAEKDHENLPYYHHMLLNLEAMERLQGATL